MSMAPVRAPGAGVRAPGVRGAISHRQGEEPHGPGRIHRHLQGLHRPAGGGVVPAPLPAVRAGRPPPCAPAQPARRAGGRHTRRNPLPQGPPGHHRRRGDGHRQDVHRSERSPRGRLQESIGPLPAAPRAEVEARGGGDGARRSRRHRLLHHRPRTPPPPPRLRPPLRGHVARAGEALLPLAARHQ